MRSGMIGAALGLAMTALLPMAAKAQGNLSVYCSVQEEWCRPMMAAFERATGISVAMTRKSSGETLTQIRAEAQNPVSKHIRPRPRPP